MTKRKRPARLAAITTLRLTPAMQERIAQLVPKVAQDETLQLVRKMTPALVLRLAITEGLRVLERRYR